MATTIERSLPSLGEIEATDEKLGSTLSDLECFASIVKHLCGDEPPLPLDEALSRLREGTLPDLPAFEYEAAQFARLLVLADEVLEDAERLGSYASELRDGLLQLYRDRVLEPPR
jgi:hypothetical protein